MWQASSWAISKYFDAQAMKESYSHGVYGKVVVSVASSSASIQSINPTSDDARIIRKEPEDEHGP